MSPPSVRVNTFVTEAEKPYIDVVSKIFIMSEVVLGLHRLPLIGKDKPIYRFLTLTIFMMWSCLVIGAMYYRTQSQTVMAWGKLSQYIFCALLSFSRCKWLVIYYDKLKIFDTEAASRPKIPNSCIRNVAHSGFMALLIVSIYVVYPLFSYNLFSYTVYSHFVTLHIVYVLEVHYYGHLLGLLVPRLKLINYYIESSLSTDTTDVCPIKNQFVYFKSYDTKVGTYGIHGACQMRKLMDLYEIIVEAYDFVLEGIKWQLLVIIITSFITILGFLYEFSLNAIRLGEIVTHNTVLHVGMTSMIMVPLFAPCTFGDSVHSEVRKLRELLASKLYENKLDKSGRGVARALLAFTETRDLSFRLLRMLNIDISLPFKFAGLLVTYLIILLQFEKVINQ